MGFLDKVDLARKVIQDLASLALCHAFSLELQLCRVTDPLDEKLERGQFLCHVPAVERHIAALAPEFHRRRSTVSPASIGLGLWVETEWVAQQWLVALQVDAEQVQGVATSRSWAHRARAALYVVHKAHHLEPRAPTDAEAGGQTAGRPWSFLPRGPCLKVGARSSQQLAATQQSPPQKGKYVLMHNSYWPFI